MGESVLTADRGEVELLFADAGLERRGGSLYLGAVPLSAIADGAGTPAYVYNAEVIRGQFRALDQALAAIPHRICYAVKANSNIGVLHILKELGAGADIVSEGELRRALKAGFPPDHIVFSGVGKTVTELRAAIDAGIGHVNVESVAELELLADMAGRADIAGPI